MQDIQIENHGSIFIFRPFSQKAKQWIKDNVQDDAQYLGDALCVEHGFARQLADGMISDGLEVA